MKLQVSGTQPANARAGANQLRQAPVDLQGPQATRSTAGSGPHLSVGNNYNLNVLYSQSLGSRAVAIGLDGKDGTVL